MSRGWENGGMGKTFMVIEPSTRALAFAGGFGSGFRRTGLPVGLYFEHHKIVKEFTDA
jgi:hypothetical protein